MPIKVADLPLSLDLLDRVYQRGMMELAYMRHEGTFYTLDDVDGWEYSNDQVYYIPGGSDEPVDYSYARVSLAYLLLELLLGHSRASMIIEDSQEFRDHRLLLQALDEIRQRGLSSPEVRKVLRFIEEELKGHYETSARGFLEDTVTMHFPRN